MRSGAIIAPQEWRISVMMCMVLVALPLLGSSLNKDMAFPVWSMCPGAPRERLWQRKVWCGTASPTLTLEPILATFCQQPCASQFRKPKMPSLAQTMQGPYFLCRGSAGNGPLAPISSGQTSIYRQIDLQGVAVEHGHWPVGSE
jgi:hypothetical protein